ncbi:MAG: uracil phosphoribosyltransferase [Chloroflexia bacterium]|nr:uracil phosphoribosyltransferase [Chloroflexia bacterium]
MADTLHSPMGARRQPSRSELLVHPRLTLAEHPLADALLAIIRDSRSGPALFGESSSKLATFLLWEACRSFQTSPDAVPGFSGAPVEVRRLATRSAGIVILRAGEVFANPFRALFPDAPLYHLGIARNEETLDHRVYSDNVPNLSIPTDRVLILDPMLATGGSVVVTIERVRKVFSGRIDVVALVSAPLGVEVVLRADERTQIVTAALDERLDENGYILPGLGDAGDRFFGTVAG